MTLILLVVLPLVVLLYVLIAQINGGEHYTPQAYYRRKRGGAPVAFGFESLGPRRRKLPPPPEAGPEPAHAESSGRELVALRVDEDLRVGLGVAER